jgi:hypothetical protein
MSIRKIKKCEKNIVALFCCSFFTALKLLFLQFFSCFCISFSAAVIYASFIAFHACILHFAPFPRPAVAFFRLTGACTAVPFGNVVNQFHNQHRLASPPVSALFLWRLIFKINVLC